MQLRVNMPAADELDEQMCCACSARSSYDTSLLGTIKMSHVIICAMSGVHSAFSLAAGGAASFLCRHRID